VEMLPFLEGLNRLRKKNLSAVLYHFAPRFDVDAIGSLDCSSIGREEMNIDRDSDDIRR
jgi:hypothetical protein